MPIRQRQFNVETPLSPAALLDQQSQQEDPFSSIFRFLFNASGRPDVPNDAAGPSAPAGDPIRDLMMTAMFGNSTPQAQDVVGSAAPPVESFGGSEIEELLR